MPDFYGMVSGRLLSFGYEVKPEDRAVLNFCIEKTESTIRNRTHLGRVPDELKYVAADMMAGEFLKAKKTFYPGDLSEMIDLDAAAKQIQEGDVSVTFAAGDGNLTGEQRFDAFVDALLGCGSDEILRFRRLVW